MSRSINKVSLLGRLGCDPDLQFTGSGTPFCRIRLTTDRITRNAEEWEERTEWHSLIAWGELADTCNNILKKDDYVYFEGRLTTRSCDDGNGTIRYFIEVTATDMILLSSEETQ